MCAAARTVSEGESRTCTSVTRPLPVPVPVRLVSKSPTWPKGLPHPVSRTMLRQWIMKRLTWNGALADLGFGGVSGRGNPRSCRGTARCVRL